MFTYSSSSLYAVPQKGLQSAIKTALREEALRESQDFLYISVSIGPLMYYPCRPFCRRKILYPHYIQRIDIKYTYAPGLEHHYGSPEHNLFERSLLETMTVLVLQCVPRIVCLASWNMYVGIN